MRRWPRWVVECAAVAGVAGVVGVAAAQTVVRDEARGWSVALPAGWRDAAPELLERVNASWRVRNPAGTLVFTRALVPEGSDGSVPPYVLVQFLPLKTRSLTHEQIATTMGMEVKGEHEAGGFEDVIASRRVDGAAYDAKRSAYAMTSTLTVPGVEVVVRNLAAGFLTTEGVVQFNCYASDGAFEGRLGEFRSMIDTVKVDESKRFRAKGEPVELKGDGSSMRIVIGLTVAAVGFGIAKSAARKRRRQQVTLGRE